MNAEDCGTKYRAQRLRRNAEEELGTLRKRCRQLFEAMERLRKRERWLMDFLVNAPHYE